MEPKVQYVMETLDGSWRVEVVKRGRNTWQRSVHAENVVGQLNIASIQRIIGEAGVDMADLADTAA